MTNAQLKQLADDWRKVLAFASSAGDTISTEDALKIIKAIARQRLGLVGSRHCIDCGTCWPSSSTI